MFSREANPTEVDFPSFTSFVAAMLVNGVIFDYKVGDPAKLDPGPARASLTRLVTARCGDYYADAPLEAARVVMFTYPRAGPAFGKARTPTGEELLRRFQL